MKQYILITLATMMTASCFAIDTLSMTEPMKPPKIPFEKSVPVSQDTSSSTGLFYLKMNVTDTDPSQNPQSNYQTFLPGIGIGYRRGVHSAVDISINNSYREDVEGDSIHSWSLPKMSYLFYLSPQRTSSFYVGTGLALGGIFHKKKIAGQNSLLPALPSENHDRYFFGIIPLICLGYEMHHRHENSWRSFIEVEVSQASLAVSQKGARPGPVAELSIGVGY